MIWEKAAIREVTCPTVLILASGMFVFNVGLSGAVFRSFRFMVLERGINIVLKALVL